MRAFARPFSLHPDAQPDYTQRMTHYAHTPIPLDFMSETRFMTEKSPTSATRQPAICRGDRSGRPSNKERSAGQCRRPVSAVSVYATYATYTRRSPSDGQCLRDPHFGRGVWGKGIHATYAPPLVGEGFGLRAYARLYLHLFTPNSCYSRSMNPESLSQTFYHNHSLIPTEPQPNKRFFRNIYTVYIYARFFSFLFVFIRFISPFPALSSPFPLSSSANGQALQINASTARMA